MKKKSTAKKVLLTILGVLLALVIVLVGTVYAAGTTKSQRCCPFSR